MRYSCKNALLLLSFNRLDTLKQTLPIIAKAAPPRIYLASDGPRLNKFDDKGISEKQKVDSIRAYLLKNISWDCVVKTRFLKENLGCKIAVSSAISWFFENEKQGIVLEDDCLPTISFFRFCDELLERYKLNEQIKMISGFSALDFAPHKNIDLLSPKAALESSYFFSKYNHIWGWASWARAWKEYDLECSDIKTRFNKLDFSSKREKEAWRKIFSAYSKGQIDTWDYPFTYSIWAKRGLCVYPKENMIKNIGFNRADAAHTTGDSKFAKMPSYELHFPLIHPREIAQHKALDKLNFLITFAKKPLINRAINKLSRKILGRNII